MTLELFRIGQELCKMVISMEDEHTDEEKTYTFKGMPEQIETWAIYHGAEREDVEDLYESLFAHEATYAGVIPGDEGGVVTSSEGARVEKVQGNVVFVDFGKKAA